MADKLTKKEQDLLVCSFRYALGRQTCIVSTVVDYLIADWEGLNDWQQKQIREDIEHAIEHKLAGDVCDVYQWKKLLTCTE